MPNQTDIIDRLPSGSRVAVIRLRSLGDCVLTTPALELLRRYRPDLEVAVAVEDRFRAIFSNPIASTVREMRAFGPRLCLNLHGGSRSARLTLLSGAETRAGFDIFRPAWIYNAPIPTAQETLGVSRRVHTAEHMASAVFHLGVPITSVPRATVPAPPGRSRFAPAGAYAVIHPVAATPEKTWPAAFFVELGRYIQRTLELEPIFIGGTGDDLSRFQLWRTVVGAPLEEIAALLRDASLFAGNDSGPAHLAAAFGIPELVFFGPSDYDVWHPWQTEARSLRAEGPIYSITVEEATRALDKLRVTAQ